jgi:hypothetical protein
MSACNLMIVGALWISCLLCNLLVHPLAHKKGGEGGECGNLKRLVVCVKEGNWCPWPSLL